MSTRSSPPSDLPDPQHPSRGLDAGESWVDTGGGAIVGGDVHTQGGDFVGRDKIIGLTPEQVSALLVQIGTTYQPRSFDGRCPYIGLDAFQESDAAHFFGREGLVARLIGLMRDQPRFLCVTGPSGSGKSSLIRAGVIPALKEGKLPRSHTWLYQSFFPGKDPIEQLALAVSRVKQSPDAARYIRREALTNPQALYEVAESVLGDQPDQRLVLFVDQFEEVFTEVGEKDEAQRLAFLNLLSTTAMRPDARVIVIIAMRSDFITRCTSYPQIMSLMNEQLQLVGAMLPDELVSAIYSPAAQVGLKIEPELVEEIIYDMKGEPGALPLMQFALKDLFDAQVAGGGVAALTRAGYLARGGVNKSLERHANAVFQQLTPDEQQLARSIFTNLIRISTGDTDTRRTADFRDLVPEGVDVERVSAVVQLLSTARLLTTDREVTIRTVTLAHEKLIEAWPWLHSLVDENRAAIVLLSQINEDARQWKDHSQDSSYLYTGTRLETVREGIQHKKLVLSGLGQEFVRIAIQTRDEAVRQDEQQRQQKLRRTRTLAAASTAVALVMLALAIFAGLQWREASRQRQQALAKQLAAQSVAYAGDRLDKALLLGMAAIKLDDSAENRSSFLSVLQTSPRLVTFLHGLTSTVRSVAYSPDGRVVAAAGFDGSIMLWGAATHQSIGSLAGNTGVINHVAFSPNKAILAAGGQDGKVSLWDITSRKSLGEIDSGLVSGVLGLAFSPDGALLATSGCGSVRADTTSCERGDIQLWDVATQRAQGAPFRKHTNAVWSIAFSPDGKLLASGSDDQTVRVWDVATGQTPDEPIAVHSEWVRAVAFSPDPEQPLLISASNDGTFVVSDPTTGQAIEQHTSEDRSPILSLAFIHDGSLLAVGSSGKTVGLWDVGIIGQANILSKRGVLAGHASAVWSVAFSPDGARLVSGSSDGKVIVWDISMGQQLGKPVAEPLGRVLGFDLSQDEKVLVSAHCQDFFDEDTHGCMHSMVQLRAGVMGTVTQVLTGNMGIKRSVVLSPDGTWLAVGGCAQPAQSGSCTQGEIRLWPLVAGSTAAAPVVLHGHRDWILSLAFSPDGATLASSSADGSVMLWDVVNGRVIEPALTQHTGPVFAIAFNPQGTQLASAGSDKLIMLWDVTSHQRLGAPLAGSTGWVWSVAFSPDGSVLASGDADNGIRLWDVARMSALSQPLLGHARAVNTLAFSHDGKRLASGGGDYAVIMWDVATHQRIGRSFEGHTNGVSDLKFLADDAHFLSSGFDGTLVEWDATWQAWYDHACAIASRTLSTDERLLLADGNDMDICRSN